MGIMTMCCNPFTEWLLYAITVQVVINICNLFLKNHLLRRCRQRNQGGETLNECQRPQREQSGAMMKTCLFDSAQLTITFPDAL